MHKLFHNIAPLSAMTVCVIWCCWTQLREATPLLAATESKLPRIERKLLHPELSAPSERDPFLQYKPPAPPVIEAIEVETKVAEKPFFDPRTVLPSIRLDATMLGARPLALISGRIYNAGERIVLDDEPEVQCRLQRVLANGVVVTIEQQTFLINYLNVSSEVTESAPEANATHEVSHGVEHELPPGIPSADELENAVAEALANQPQPTQDQVDSDSDATGDLSTDAADEDCEYELDLLNTNKFDEFLNNHE